MKDTTVLILAAGDGKRMKSDIPKVLHKAAGRALVDWVVTAAEKVIDGKPIVVYGSGGSAVPDYLGDRCTYALQDKRLGSGHAVMMAEDLLKDYKYAVVLAGDMPLVRESSLEKLITLAEAGDYSALLLTGEVENPTGYGRIKRNGSQVVGIVEEKDATEEERAIKEVNLSFYCFRVADLLAALDEVKPNNTQGEYYITDCIEIMYMKGQRTGAILIDDMEECYGVNDRSHLAMAGRALRSRINERLMTDCGVTMIDPSATYIDADVEVGPDTVIYPGVILEGKTKIGAGCTLYQGSRIADSTIGDGTVVQNSVVQQSTIGCGTQVGPYAFIRPGTQIGDGCRVGDFVEMKNSTIGDGTKVSHLTYVGDSDLGRDINIGCGVVFVNYDGKEKHRSAVGDGAFIGCNTNLISPVSVGSGAYIAAGATVTKDIPDDALCIARARELIKEGWGKDRYKR